MSPVSDKDVSPSNSDKNNRTLRLVQELKVVHHFSLVVRNKFDEMLRNNDIGLLHDEERKAYFPITKAGFWPGVTAGVVSFVLIRRARSALFRGVDRICTKLLYPGKPRVPNNSPFRSVFQNNISTENMQKPLPPLFVPPPGFTFFNTFWFFTDVIFSWSVAKKVSFIVSFSDINKLMEVTASLPLIQGKSTVADRLCPVMTTEWMRLEREAAVAAAATNEVQVLDAPPSDNALSGQSVPDPLYLSIAITEWMRLEREAAVVAAVTNEVQVLDLPPNDNALSGLSASGSPLLSIATAPESPYLRAVVEFKDNCLRRQAYERRLRRYSGLDSHAPVDIPPPGVPTGDDPSQLLLQLDGDGSADDSDYSIGEKLSWTDGEDSSNWDDSVSPK
jgi:hypothetical protein